MTSTNVAQWGRRLSDRVRETLLSEDYATAHMLCVRGDGQSRSLAKEFSLMFKGLADTVRVLLNCMAAMLEQEATNAAAGDARTAAVLFASNLRCQLAGSLADLNAPDQPHAPAREFAAESAAVSALLQDLVRSFNRIQESTAEEIGAAIEKRDRTLALSLLDRKELHQYIPLHDCFVRAMANAFAWALRHFGNAGLLRFHLATAEALRPGFEAWECMSPSDFARATAFLLKQHMGQVAVTETAERFTFEQTLCGSGGRLRTMGAYQADDGLPHVEGCVALTFGEPSLPVYCTHCAVWNGVAPFRWFGHAQWIFSAPARPDGGCTFHIYKRQEDIPADYAARLRQVVP